MAAPLDTPVHLAARGVLDIRDGKGIEVRCLCGTVWITQAGDREDIVLHGGQFFVLERQGLALVTALLGPAMVVIEPGRIDARPSSDRTVPSHHPIRCAA
jgi:Protein of unknown function (DUF2917)